MSVSFHHNSDSIGRPSSSGCRWGAGRACQACGVLLVLMVGVAPVTAQQPPADSADAGAPTTENVASDWAAELLDGILSASNPRAAESLYDAAFAAGPDLIPQLQAALKDDRTAEFAAQALAFIGGEKSIKILQTLVSDPRNLDLRRFYLGALGEFPSPQVNELLLRAVEKSDLEPDRTVTEAAIWALTVRTNASLAARLREAEPHIQDLVIREAADNASDAIDARVRYLASPDGEKAGSSVPEAVRTYFIGAIESPASPAAARRPGPAEPPARAEVKRLTVSPDGTRALAHVTFSDPDGSANYDMVLQKEYGDWKVVSVWMRSSAMTPEPRPPAKSPKRPKAPVRVKPSK